MFGILWAQAGDGRATRAVRSGGEPRTFAECKAGFVLLGALPGQAGRADLRAGARAARRGRDPSRRVSLADGAGVSAADPARRLAGHRLSGAVGAGHAAAARVEGAAAGWAAAADLAVLGRRASGYARDGPGAQCVRRQRSGRA